MTLPRSHSARVEWRVILHLFLSRCRFGIAWSLAATAARRIPARDPVHAPRRFGPLRLLLVTCMVEARRNGRDATPAWRDELLPENGARYHFRQDAIRDNWDNGPTLLAGADAATCAPAQQGILLPPTPGDPSRLDERLWNWIHVRFDFT